MQRWWRMCVSPLPTCEVDHSTNNMCMAISNCGAQCRVFRQARQVAHGMWPRAGRKVCATAETLRQGTAQSMRRHSLYNLFLLSDSAVARSSCVVVCEHLLSCPTRVRPS